MDPAQQVHAPPLMERAGHRFDYSQQKPFLGSERIDRNLTPAFQVGRQQTDLGFGQQSPKGQERIVHVCRQQGDLSLFPNLAQALPQRVFCHIFRRIDGALSHVTQIRPDRRCAGIRAASSGAHPHALSEVVRNGPALAEQLLDPGLYLFAFAAQFV